MLPISGVTEEPEKKMYLTDYSVKTTILDKFDSKIRRSLMTFKIEVSGKMNFVEMERWSIHEFFESIGGLVNATEKLLMWIVTFWSVRLFWLNIFAKEFGQDVKPVRSKYGVKTKHRVSEDGINHKIVPSLTELLRYEW
jgi:hypothetical protein